MHSLKSWIKVLLLAALVGTGVRLVFFILLAPPELTSMGHKIPYAEIFHAFLLGFRFDLSATCYLTLIFWMISFFLPKIWSLFIWKCLLSFWGFLLLVDIGYFSFYNDRLNVLMFGLFEDDTWALIKTFWKNYPVIPILLCAGALSYFFHRLIKNEFKIDRNFRNHISTPLTRALILVLLVIGARGTFALFPLGDHDTVVSSVPFLNTLSFGTAHAFSRAIKLKREQIKMGSSEWFANLKEFGYLNKEDQAFIDYFDSKIPPGGNRFQLMNFKTQLNFKRPSPPHVVLIVMESWGTYGLQFQNDNFNLVGGMKNHFTRGLLNTQFLSTTPATTGSLSCLLAGVPQRAISPFLTESDYLHTQLTTSPAVTFKKAGYQTRFVYGGNPGWRDMNKFALAQGFDDVLGEVDIQKKFSPQQLEKHDWGIYDHDLFNYVESLLREAEKPQLIVVMTTSNHPPYELPTTAQKHTISLDQFPERAKLIDQNLALKRFLAFRYSSDSLSEFLDQIQRNEKLHSSTITAVTADHTFWIKNFSHSEIFMKSAVPFFLTLPPNLSSQLSLKQSTHFRTSFASHHDIWPTLYDVALKDSMYQTFGRSLFQNSTNSFALSFERAIFSKDRAVYVQSANQFSSMKAVGPLTYETTPEVLDADHQMSQKYRSLMGALDSFLYHSKIKQ
ncbi:MAG: hypothetical protein A2622_01175 [Bdellovibrionales bacterium RIFCSPHIGHO2_01_FULL_40_29]|nr:MAG: hypothetical protein A2622_01175 [Bdellovibrionales bacterium RIFCSPHIGHO2_01_FULL_40_29]OFZ32725.1 MAG: hypothetical protein A3D17_05775 [Bdellovibrionales bacterium RIFCSPHIGHO2_02_FULL_40_15]